MRSMVECPRCLDARLFYARIQALLALADVSALEQTGGGVYYILRPFDPDKRLMFRLGSSGRALEVLANDSERGSEELIQSFRDTEGACLTALVSMCTYLVHWTPAMSLAVRLPQGEDQRLAADSDLSWSASLQCYLLV